MDFEQTMLIVQALIIVVLSILVSRSYQPGQVELLLNRLADPVAKSDTKIDDMLLTLAEMLHEARASPVVQEISVDGDDTDKQ